MSTSDNPTTPDASNHGERNYALLFSILAFATALFGALSTADDGYQVAVRGFGLSTAAFLGYLIWRAFTSQRSFSARRVVPAIVLASAVLCGGLALVLRPNPAARIDEAERATAQLESLRAGVNIVNFFREFGDPLISHEHGDLSQLFFVSRYYYVQTLVDVGGEVLLLSVTARHPDVRPRFTPCASTDQHEVVLGETTFGELEPSGPYGVHYFSTNGGTSYSELYGGIGACSFVHQILTFNELVTMMPRSELGGVATLAVEFGGLVVAGDSVHPLMDSSGESTSYESDVLLANPLFLKERANLLIDTYSETVRDIDFFAKYPQFFSFRDLIDFGPAYRDWLTAGG